MFRQKRQSEDGMLGAFQTAGMVLAFGLLFEPVREAILFSGATGIGCSVFILLGALVIAIYRFVMMQVRRFGEAPPTSNGENGTTLEWESVSSAGGSGLR